MSFKVRQLFLLFSLLASSFIAPVSAQTADDDMQLMRQSIELLSTTLEEGLGLNERRGVFSPRAGDISGRYLQRHGVVLEVTRNWQQRDLPAVDSFSESLVQLSSQLDGLILQGVIQRPDFESMRDQLALSMRSDEVAVFYREVMQQISAMQEIPAIERGLAVAVSSIQTLQSMGQLDDGARQAISSEIEGLRAELDQQLETLGELRDQIRQQALASQSLPDLNTQTRWLAVREKLIQDLQLLQSRLGEQVEMLDQRRQLAEQLGREQAELAFEIFQTRLFELLCDYGAGLRGLPDQESINIILIAAGEPFVDNKRRDIVYRLDKDALMDCQQGRLTALDLQSAASRYQY